MKHIFEVPQNAQEALAIIGQKITGIGTSVAVIPIKGEFATFRVANLLIAAFCDTVRQIQAKQETGEEAENERLWLAIYDAYFGSMDMIQAAKSLIFFKTVCEDIRRRAQEDYE